VKQSAPMTGTGLGKSSFQDRAGRDHEGSTICEKDLRRLQDHSSRGRGAGDLQEEPEA
jgi:hypothetical protein